MTTAFKTGDRVTVDQSFEPAGTTIYATRKGTVSRVYGGGTTISVSFDNDGGLSTGTFAKKYLVSLDEPKLFKKGDKVIVDLDEPKSSWHKSEGTVVEDQLKATGTTRVELTKLGPSNKYASVGTIYRLVGLTKVEEPKPFTYGDIQKGDTIRRTKVYKSGAKEVREGVATTKGTYYWAQDNFILGYDEDHESGDVTYELLNRPEPKPKITDGTKIGDQIVVVRTVNTKVYAKKADDTWDTLIIGRDEKPNRGFTWTDAEVAHFASYGKATLVKA